MNKLAIYLHLTVAAISISLGFVILFFNLTEENGGVPYEHTLIKKSGEIDWVKKEKYGIKFQFLDKKLLFTYNSKLGGMNSIYQALQASNGKIVSIKYKETTRRSGFSGDVYHGVWTIDIDGNSIRTYSESERAWRNDEYWLFVVVPLFILGGAHIARKSFRRLKSLD